MAPYPSFLAAEMESTCHSYSTQLFCFWFSIASQGVMFQHQQKKINIIFTKNTILTSWEDKLGTPTMSLLSPKKPWNWFLDKNLVYQYYILKIIPELIIWLLEVTNAL